MPTLPIGGIPPPSPVPRATRPFLFGEGITDITTGGGGGSPGPQGPTGPQGPPGAQGPNGLTGIYNVATYGAMPGGSDSTGAIQRAITAGQGNGILYFPPGAYSISAPLTITKPLTIWGAGSGMDWNNASDAPWAPLSSLVATASMTSMVSITGPTGPIYWQGMGLDCANLAANGIAADQWQAGGGTDVAIRRSTGYALDLQTTSGTANVNTMGLAWNGLYLRGNGLLRMRGNGTHTANCCHNTFNGIIGSYSGSDGIHLSDADNNRFLGTFLFSEAGVGSNYGVYFDTYARGNYFYGLEPGINGTFSALPNTATWSNTIIGYDRNNGQAAPTITSNPGHNSLVWTEDGANSTGWNNLSMVNATLKSTSGGSSVQAVRYFDSNTGRSMYVRGLNTSGGLAFLNNAFTTQVLTVDDTGILNATAYLSANNAVTVTSNAGTVPITPKLSTFTNSSAATMAITLTTTGAIDGQPLIVRIYDFSAAAQTIGWTNTENSTVSVPTTSNGSTTLPVTVGFMFNSATSKWRCVASA